MVERILAHQGNQSVYDFRIGNRPTRFDPPRRVRLILPAQSHDDMGNRASKQMILGLVALLDRGEFGQALTFETSRFAPQPVRLLMIQRTHPRFPPRPTATQPP